MSRCPGYQPTTEGNQKQIRQAAKALADCAAAGDLRRRRRGQRERGGRSWSSSRPRTSFPVTCTLMGLGGVPGAAPAVARNARDARHAHGELRDGRRRPDLRRSARASTIASPASSRSSRRMRSSSTSTSTRPRSRRTCRRTSRSSATPRTSSPRLTAEYRALEPEPTPARGVVVADPARGSERHPLALRGLDRLRDQAPVHDPGAVRGDRRRRDRRLATSASIRCGRRSTTRFDEPRRWINSGGLGTMGFGLPAAMGAKVGCPDGPSSASPATARSR